MRVCTLVRIVLFLLFLLGEVSYGVALTKKYRNSALAGITDDDEVVFEAEEHEMPPIPAEYRGMVKPRPAPNSAGSGTAARNSATGFSDPPNTLPDTLSNTLGNPADGIEITEHADGSVVWQVIRGLARRDSTGSSTGRDSLAPSGDRFSLFPSRLRSPSNHQWRDSRNSYDRDSVWEGGTRASAISGRLSGVLQRPLSGTSSGLFQRRPSGESGTTPEDLRAFFASHRLAVQTAPETDDSYNLPLSDAYPTAASSLGPAPRGNGRSAGAETGNPDTHVIWTSGQDVSAMLESLSRGTDSAKFEIKLDGDDASPPPLPAQRGGLAREPAASQPGAAGSASAGTTPRLAQMWEEEQALNARVEEEILRFLGRHTPADAADPSGGPPAPDTHSVAAPSWGRERGRV